MINNVHAYYRPLCSYLKLTEVVTYLMPYDKFLEPSEQFSILQGDMVATCWNSNNRVELYCRNFGRELISDGQCLQETIDGPSDVRW